MRPKAAMATIVVGAALLLLGAQAAPAGMPMLGEVALRYYVSDADGSAHPKRIEFVQMIESDLSHLEEVFLFFEYDIGLGGPDQPPTPTAGRVVATARRLQNGKWKKLGKLKATVISEGSEAQAWASKPIGATLEAGDLILWRLKLTNLPPVDHGFILSIEAGILLVDPADL